MESGGLRMTAEDSAEAYAEWEKARRQAPAQRAEDCAEWRAEMVSRYYESERRGRRGQIADGVDPSCYGW